MKLIATSQANYESYDAANSNEHWCFRAMSNNFGSDIGFIIASVYVS